MLIESALVRKRTWPVAQASLILAGVCALIGCASAPGIRTRVERDIHGLAAREIDAAVARYQPARGNEPVSIPFAEAFSRAAGRDPELKTRTIACVAAQTDIEQAESARWPRFTAELSVEAPIGGNDIGGYHYIGGGVFLHYNIMDAVFSADAVAAGQAQRDVLRQQQQATVKKIYYGLLLLLCRMDFERNAAAEARNTLQTAQEAQNYINTLSDVEPVSPEAIRQWDEAVRRGNWTREVAEQHFVSAREELQLVLGLDACPDVIVPDRGEFLPKPSDIPENDGDFVKQAWEQRNDVRIAESELFLAEMRIADAKRKRLPNPTASLGLGNVLLHTNQQAAVVPYVQISMPLFDMGDVKRKVQKAKGERDIAEENLTAKARDLVRTIRNAAVEVRLARSRLQAAEDRVRREQENRARAEQLASMKRQDFLARLTARLTEAEAQAELNTAVYEFRRTTIALAEARGDMPKGELVRALDVQPK